MGTLGPQQSAAQSVVGGLCGPKLVGWGWVQLIICAPPRVTGRHRRQGVKYCRPPAPRPLTGAPSSQFTVRMLGPWARGSPQSRVSPDRPPRILGTFVLFLHRDDLGGGCTPFLTLWTRAPRGNTAGGAAGPAGPLPSVRWHSPCRSTEITQLLETSLKQRLRLLP